MSYQHSPQADRDPRVPPLLQEQWDAEARQHQRFHLHPDAEPLALLAPGSVAELAAVLADRLSGPRDSITLTINVRREHPHA